MSANNNYIERYNRIKKRLKIVSYGFVALLLALQIFLGQTRFQQLPMISLGGIKPVQINVFVVICLVGILIFIMNYWKCPKCQVNFFFSLKANRYQYTYDLESCPNCKTILKEKQAVI